MSLLKNDPDEVGMNDEVIAAFTKGPENLQALKITKPELASEVELALQMWMETIRCE